jgi:ABC-2 type transport system permease protein
MRTFLHILKLAILQQTTYRTALLAGLTTNFFFGLFRAAVIVALYGQQREVNGLSLAGSLTYVAAGQALIAFLFVFGTFDLMQTVYTGNIAADLLRPVHLEWLWLARDLGQSLVNLVVRGLLLVLIFGLFYPVALPADGLTWLWSCLSLALAWLLSFAWRFLVNLAAFWTPDARGIGRGAFMFSQLLSGFLVPLRLYPDWFSQICAWTPFPSMMNTSLEVYLGITQGEALWHALGIQLAWLALLALACRVVLRAGLGRLVVQGG